MRPGAIMAASAAAAAALAAPAPATIVRVSLWPEDSERQPFAVPTEPGNTVEVDLPWPLEDWAGRGFTPDSERYAGDFVIQAARGTRRLFVTPVAQDAHRVLHVVMAQGGGATRSLPLEFIPAPPTLAWRKVSFVAAAPQGAQQPPVSLLRAPPRSRLRAPGPDSEIGLIRTMRLLLNTTAEGARGIVAANPALALAAFDSPPRDLGPFSLACRFAVRDSNTGALGLCVSVANQTPRRLLFDPMSWVVRVGERVYPVGTVDFASELEPRASAAAFLVVAGGPDGETTGLLADNAFEPSVALGGSVNPRPVRRLSVEEPDAR
jgi:hypothetical protein